MKIISSFEGENMQTQFNFLGYSVEMQFHHYKLAIEFYVNERSVRNVVCEIKKQKAIEQELGCKFIRIDPNKAEFDIFQTINEILRHIKQLTKKNSNK